MAGEGVVLVTVLVEDLDSLNSASCMLQHGYERQNALVVTQHVFCPTRGRQNYKHIRVEPTCKTDSGQGKPRTQAQDRGGSGEQRYTRRRVGNAVRASRFSHLTRLCGYNRAQPPAALSLQQRSTSSSAQPERCSGVQSAQRPREVEEVPVVLGEDDVLLFLF
ncbi:unnamed protein product [Boreogadus saida]